MSWFLSSPKDKVIKFSTLHLHFCIVMRFIFWVFVIANLRRIEGLIATICFVHCVSTVSHNHGGNNASSYMKTTRCYSCPLLGVAPAGGLHPWMTIECTWSAFCWRQLPWNDVWTVCMFHAGEFLLFFKHMSPVVRDLCSDTRFSSASVTEDLCSSPQSRAEAAVFECWCCHMEGGERDNVQRALWG